MTILVGGAVLRLPLQLRRPRRTLHIIPRRQVNQLADLGVVMICFRTFGSKREIGTRQRLSLVPWLVAFGEVSRSLHRYRNENKNANENEHEQHDATIPPTLTRRPGSRLGITR